MRTSRLASPVLVLAALTAAAPAAAQTTVFVNTGITAPTGDYSFLYDPSYNGSATLDVAVTDYLALGLRVGYHRAKFDDNALLEDKGLEGLGFGVEGPGSLAVVMPTARLMYRPGTVEVYGVVGLGFVRSTLEDILVYQRGGTLLYPGSTEEVLGAQLGAGIRLPSGPFSFFAEVGYMAAFTEVQTRTAVPARLGMAYTFGWSPGR